ncbi:MAG: phage capsid protein [Pseudomonadota bacterium]
MSNKSAFPITPELTAVALAYRNKNHIADAVLPRVLVGSQTFKYFKFDKGQLLTIPDTKVGRTSSPNKIEFRATEVESSTHDYGLEDPVPNSDIINAPANYSPLMYATEGLTDLIALDREKRASDLVFNASNYDAACKRTLATSEQFNDFIASDPLEVILNALKSMIMRGNIMVIGRDVFTMLCRHPKVVKTVNRNSGDSGVARREEIAQIFELEQVLVGESWYNTSNKGQDVVLGSIWGKHIALLYRDLVAKGQRSRPTFGITAQFGSKIAGSEYDKSIGLRGGEMVRVGESVKEVICANDLGYFIENAVA